MLRYQVFLSTGGTEHPVNPVLAALSEKCALRSCVFFIKAQDTATGGAADAAARNPLVVKKGGRSHVWKYFVFATDDKGNIIDHQKPICKRCHLSSLSKGGNTSNLIKHLKDRHPDLMKEFKQHRIAICFGSSKFLYMQQQRQ
ncbi:E3 SUMO-protein ligase ZBED1 [Labeo rohita]|uniref:E3 SUMO-protein ligase ZBED1 n=1 Tax=Labeo rohita TaxID=84645 RepID=A0ABQ8M234_LABRO|nr:E3 SUMO-protein ligase ZBED1 [Labeo rohita]